MRSTYNTTSFPGLQCEDEARHEEALVWAGHVSTQKMAVLTATRQGVARYSLINSFSTTPFASYYDTILSNKISRRVFIPLLNKSHHCNPHKITFRTGGQVPSKHYTKRNNHIFTHRLAKDSKFHINKILNIS
jgi:hypothetical protein